jgi:hypothetical protein
MPVKIPTCNVSALELTCCLIVRSERFYAKTFFSCQSVATLCVVLLPLFVTKTASYGAASKACYDWSFSWRNETHFDVGSQKNYDPEWDMDDSANWHLFPMHLFNSISTVMSLFGFGVWLFFSTHNSDVARDLDRTCRKKNDCIFSTIYFTRALTIASSRVFLAVGSYFALQWLANILVAATILGDNCVQSYTAHTVLILVSFLASSGLSIIGTNLLCHRYLVEKARVMIKLYGTSATHIPRPIFRICTLITHTPNHVFLSCLCHRLFF